MARRTHGRRSAEQHAVRMACSRALAEQGSTGETHHCFCGEAVQWLAGESEDGAAVWLPFTANHGRVSLDRCVSCGRAPERRVA